MDLLDLYTYFFELPLYAKVEVDTEKEEDKIFEIIWSEKGIDAYNPTIKENTTYFIIQPKQKYYNLSSHNGLILTRLSCSRTGEIVEVVSYFDFKNGIIQKVGQYPSIAHFHISKIKDYSKVLEDDKVKEFTRAIGLAANGVGIGSFVYLRRIFEHLLEKEHVKAKSKAGWDEEHYLKCKVVDRIELLKDFLPKFLVDNKPLYGILSVGIHSLTEEDCLKYFDTVKLGIELILDEQLEKYRRDQKISEASKRLSIVNQQIKEQNKKNVTPATLRDKSRK